MPGKESFFALTASVTNLGRRIFRSIKRFIKSLLPGASAGYLRLEGDILAFEKDLNYLTSRKSACCLIQGNIGFLSWVDPAEDLLKKAKKALEDYDFSLGWRCLHKAQSISLRGLEEEDREAKAKVILNESRDKLGTNSWRKKSIEDLLTKQGELKTIISSEELVEANDIIAIIVLIAILMKSEDMGVLLGIAPFL